MNEISFEKASSTLKFKTFQIRGLVCSTVPNGTYELQKIGNHVAVKGLDFEIGHATKTTPVLVVQNQFIMARIQSWLDICEGGLFHVND